MISCLLHSSSDTVDDVIDGDWKFKIDGGLEGFWDSDFLRTADVTETVIKGLAVFSAPVRTLWSFKADFLFTPETEVKSDATPRGSAKML